MLGRAARLAKSFGPSAALRFLPAKSGNASRCEGPGVWGSAKGARGCAPRRGRVAPEGTQGQALLGRGARRQVGAGRKVANRPAGPEGGPGTRAGPNVPTPGGRPGSVAPEGGPGREAGLPRAARRRPAAWRGLTGPRGWDTGLSKPKTPAKRGSQGVGTRSGAPPVGTGVGTLFDSLIWLYVLYVPTVLSIRKIN